MLSNQGVDEFIESMNFRRILDAGLMGLIVGFLGGIVDGLIVSDMGKASVIVLEIAASLLVLVPFGCLAGIGLSTLVLILGKINLRAQHFVVRSFPYLWIGLVFIYLAVSYYHGLAGFYPAYARYTLSTLLVGIPSYICLRILWECLSKVRPAVMVFLALLVGACVALVELTVI